MLLFFKVFGLVKGDGALDRHVPAIMVYIAGVGASMHSGIGRSDNRFIFHSSVNLKL